MRRKKRFKKIRLPSFSRDLREHIFKRIVGAFAIFLFFTISLLTLKTFLYRSDYFKLRSVEIKDALTGQNVVTSANSELLRLYKDKNIFEININGISKSLEDQYPAAKEIVTRRLLPDKLAIDLKFRRPVALVSGAKYYPVDEEGFIVPNVDATSLRGLPIIVGVDIRNEWKKNKRSIESKNLKAALDLLSEMRNSKLQAEYSADTIDAGDMNNMAFYLKNKALEVRIGCEDFKERLSKLKKTLRDPRLAVDKIKYIDLRFKDVVIGPK